MTLCIRINTIKVQFKRWVILLTEEHKKRIAVSITPEMDEKLREEAKDRGLSISTVLTLALEEYSKTAKIIMFFSIVIVIIGYFLWTVMLPLPDYYSYSEAQQLVLQKRFAFNYPLGRSLLYIGFTGLITSSGYLIISAIKKRIASK